jgi:hypothetical protein
MSKRFDPRTTASARCPGAADHRRGGPRETRPSSATSHAFPVLPRQPVRSAPGRRGGHGRQRQPARLLPDMSQLTWKTTDPPAAERRSSASALEDGAG